MSNLTCTREHSHEQSEVCLFVGLWLDVFASQNNVKEKFIKSQPANFTNNANVHVCAVFTRTVKSRIFRTHSIFVSWALRPFVRMKFSYSRWLLRILWLASYLSHAFFFSYGSHRVRKIHENNMPAKYSGFTVLLFCVSYYPGQKNRFGREIHEVDRRYDHVISCDIELRFDSDATRAVAGGRKLALQIEVDVASYHMIALWINLMNILAVMIFLARVVHWTLGLV